MLETTKKATVMEINMRKINRYVINITSFHQADAIPRHFRGLPHFISC